MDNVVEFIGARCLQSLKNNIPEARNFLTSTVMAITAAAMREMEKKLLAVCEHIASEAVTNKITSSELALDYFLSQIFGAPVNERDIPEVSDRSMEAILRTCHRDLISNLQLQYSPFLKDLRNHDVMDQLEADSIIGKPTTRDQNEEFIRWSSAKLSIEQFEQTVIPLLETHQPEVASILKQAVTDTKHGHTRPSCPVCTLKGNVQPKRLADYLLQRGVITANLYDDLRNPSNTNEEKWRQLEERLAAPDIPILMKALKKCYPELHKELLESQILSLKCNCAVQSLVPSETQPSSPADSPVGRVAGKDDRSRIASALHECKPDLAPNLDLRGTTILDALCQDGLMDDQEVESVVQKQSSSERYEDFVRIVSARCSVDMFRHKIIPQIQDSYSGIAKKLTDALGLTSETIATSKQCASCKLKETVELKRVAVHLESEGAIASTLSEDLLNRFSTNDTKWKQLQKYMKVTHMKTLIDALRKPYPELYQELKDASLRSLECVCSKRKWSQDGAVSSEPPERPEKVALRDETVTAEVRNKGRSEVAAILNRCRLDLLRDLDLQKTDLLTMIVKDSSEKISKQDRDHVMSHESSIEQKEAFLRLVRERFTTEDLSHVLCRYLRISHASSLTNVLQKAIIDEKESSLNTETRPDLTENFLPKPSEDVKYLINYQEESTVTFKPADEDRSSKDVFRKGLVKFAEGDYMAIWTSVEVGDLVYYTLRYDPLVATSTSYVQQFDLGKTYSNIKLRCVEETDKYSKGRPYALLRYPQSSITFSFKISSRQKSTLLCLHHCRTTSDAFIDVYINGVAFLNNFGSAPRDDFLYQVFYIPGEKLKEGKNVIEFRLNQKSRGVYWLSELSILLVKHIPSITSLTSPEVVSDSTL